MNKYYPNQVFMTTWKTGTLLQVGCRPDALVQLCADILVAGGRNAPQINIGSVEHRGDDIASFLINMEVPKHLREELLSLVDSYQRKP